MGGIAPVRQSDRLVGFTAEAPGETILSASSGKERCNAFASHPMALAFIRPFLVRRIERENSCFCPRRNVACGTSGIDPKRTARLAYLVV
jgi:hypothetical protein